MGRWTKKGKKSKSRKAGEITTGKAAVPKVARIVAPKAEPSKKVTPEPQTSKKTFLRKKRRK